MSEVKETDEEAGNKEFISKPHCQQIIYPDL
jgi:hypothetical protein